MKKKWETPKVLNLKTSNTEVGSATGNTESATGQTPFGGTTFDSYVPNPKLES